jgi:diacylglycerol kinase (ATP)
MEPVMNTRTALLIFNPNSGPAGDAPFQLLQIIQSLQAQSIQPEVLLTEPGVDLAPAIQAALARGTALFVVCGGDGTLGAAACALANSRAVLAVIPTGTQNNIALSLGIPFDLPAAAALLTSGQPQSIDLGIVSTGSEQRFFIEVCSLGLISALFSPADEIQHGNLAGIGDFLSRLVSTPGAQLHLQLDDDQEIRATGHTVLVSNMPYFGLHFKIAPDASCRDGLLDVMLFNDMTRLDLLDYAIPLMDDEIGVFSPGNDPRLRHFHARKVVIHSDPALPILVDGQPMGVGPITLQVWPQALNVLMSAPSGH